MSAERDCSHIYAAALLSQLSSHGSGLTSSRLLKTVSADRRQERGVNTLAPHKPSRSLNNSLKMETRGCLRGRLIIGVVWLLARASWLHFLTPISEAARPASSQRLAGRRGACFHGLLPASSCSSFISHSFQVSLPRQLRPALLIHLAFDSTSQTGKRGEKKELILSKHNQERTQGSVPLR